LIQLHPLAGLMHCVLVCITMLPSPALQGIGALSPGERSTSQELPAEAEQAPAAAGMHCWALPTATSTQQFAVTSAEPADNAEASGAKEPAAPMAARHSDQQLPGAATSPQSADCDEATDDSHGSLGSGQSRSAAGVAPAPATAPAGIGKVAYPQLEAAAHTAPQQNGHNFGKPDPAAQQANTTQLLNQRVQEWD
jgi:hypothetical protein